MCERGPMRTESKPASVPLLAAGLLGLSGVALGAMGAHALKATLLERGTAVAWETAARYHIIHAVALLAVAGWLRIDAEIPRTLANWIVRSWVTGVGLFSGSLYWLAIGGPRWLGPVTPLGGVALMAGWLLIALAGLRRRG